MTTDDTTIPVPRHLIETLRDANLPANHPILNGTIAAIVALLPPPKRWTDEDVEMLAETIGRGRFGEDYEPSRAWEELAEAVLTALDEAGRLKEVTDE